ncbi:MAG: hypothetical protein ABW318_09375 [Vicinamibacterales bacterium]
MLPSLLATIAAIPPVEVTAAVTRTRLVIHAGHIARLLGFHSSFVPFSTRRARVIVMRYFYRRGGKPWE